MYECVDGIWEQPAGVKWWMAGGQVSCCILLLLLVGVSCLRMYMEYRLSPGRPPTGV